MKKQPTHANSQVRIHARAAAAAVLVALAGGALGGCKGLTQSYQRGYVLPEGALEQIPLGASQDQVLVVLGTPSTVATVSGEVFYYISQRTEQTSFLPQEEVNRRVIAVYFDKNRKVERLADYGMKDGKVFDFISRTTASGGQELNVLTYMIRAVKLNP
ncbi:MAG TPA: outer membrane protein assembly factor BamE [Xanthobacteraceae bacterium]|nr:outer membrane protein assembly factor BamE [Xanthobacteraceae bacterium]